MATCSSCHRQIIWCRTEATGKLMPVDPDPVPDGLVVKTGRTEPDPWGGPRPIDVVHVLNKTERSLFDQDDDEPDGPRFDSHFVHCSGAAKHRRSR